MVRVPASVFGASSYTSQPSTTSCLATISAVPRLDPSGSIVEALSRGADLSIRSKNAPQATPAPTQWSCNHCRTVQALGTEDCPECDDGVHPRPEG